MVVPLIGSRRFLAGQIIRGVGSEWEGIPQPLILKLPGRASRHVYHYRCYVRFSRGIHQLHCVRLGVALYANSPQVSQGEQIRAHRELYPHKAGEVIPQWRVVQSIAGQEGSSGISGHDSGRIVGGIVAGIDFPSARYGSRVGYARWSIGGHIDRKCDDRITEARGQRVAPRARTRRLRAAPD